jgi:hypothetical protein
LQGTVSDRQSGAALGATGIDHTTAILGAHPGTETVGALPLQITGLIGSFHGTQNTSRVSTHAQPDVKGRKYYCLYEWHVNLFDHPGTWNKGVDNFFPRV